MSEFSFSDVDAGDSRAAIDYLDAVSRISVADKDRTFAIQRLAPGMRVLDIGCGTGDDVRTIAEVVGQEGRVTGIDPSRTLIDEASSRGVPSNARFAVASANALPFDDAHFDAVRAERVFQHLNDADAAAREMKRVLAPGGSALLLDQDWETLMIAGGERSLTARIVRALADHVVNPWAGREAAGLLCRAGFADVEVLPSIGTPTFSLAVQSILRPAMQAAVQANVVDARTADQWLHSLLEADLRREFFCGVVVIVALGRVA